MKVITYWLLTPVRARAYNGVQRGRGTMELKDLRYFCLAAELGSITKAAETLGVSRAAVHAAVCDQGHRPPGAGAGHAAV